MFTLAGLPILPQAQALTNPTLLTDKDEYSPEQTVTITGTGMTPGMSYDIPVIRPDGSIVHGDGSFTPGWDSVQADADGEFVYKYQLDGIKGLYTIRLYDSPWSGNRLETPIVSKTFLDAAAADLDGCADENPQSLTACDATHASEWTNGNLNESGSNVSQYFEGDSVPYRISFTGLTAGVHTVNLFYDTTQSGKHAYDYLTTFNRTITGADPCAGISGCTGPTSSFPIPADPSVISAGVTPVLGSFKGYNATITGATTPVLASGSYASGSTTKIVLTFSTTVADPVIAFSTHIATRADWGADNSAAAIGGSPFHVAVSKPDDDPLANSGQQAKQIKAAAIIFPGSVTIVKDVAGGTSTQAFDYTTSGGLSPSTFTLDDDGNNGNTHSNTQAFPNVTNFTTYTVSETTVPGWSVSFGTPVCTVTSANSGTQSGSGATLTINLHEGENVTCVFTNTRDQGTVQLKKHWVGTAGSTTLKIGSTAGGSDLSSTPVSGADGQTGTIAGNTGTYYFSEDSTGLANYDTSFACTGAAASPSQVGGSAYSYSLAVAKGETVTCTFTNTRKQGSLIVKKIVTNDNGGTSIATDFSFQVNGGSSTAFLQDTDALHGKNTLTLDTGTYSVTEPGVAGYTTSYSGCTNVSVTDTTPVTCTITNDDQAATLTVTKTVVNNNGGSKHATDFSFSVNGAAAQAFLQDGADTLKGKNALSVNAGTYNVTEPSVSGYGQSLTGCSNISLVIGGSATCAITNDDQAGTLIVKKVVTNDNGGTQVATDFSFQVNGGSAIAFLQDTDTLHGLNSLTENAGTYTVTEPAASGYTTTYSNCSNVSVPNGGTVTCTITNNDQAGTLIVKKVVTNDNGGSGVATDFSFKVNGGSATSFLQDTDTLHGKNTLTVDAGSYSVTEPAAAGYTTTYSNCDNVSVANGGTQTCTITNDDQQGTLIVKKVVNNDNGGSAVATDFSFKVNGGSATSFLQDTDTLHGKNTLTVDAGSYTVTEPAAAGYTTTYSNCSNVSVSNGGTQTCTITNDDQSGTLIVKKVVVNDNGGSEHATDFSFKVNGGSATSFLQDTDTLHGKNTLTVDAGSYTVTEPAAAGYTTTYSNCDNVSVSNGGTQTCTITNNDQTATLHVIKHVDNTHGGTLQSSDFQITVTGGSPSPATFPGADTPGTTVTINAGSYNVAEATNSGYADTYSADCTGSIANGEEKTCLITNSDLPGTLIVKKVVKNDNGGSKHATDFTFQVNGGAATHFTQDADTLHGKNTLTEDAGGYTVIEPAVAGYTPTYSNDANGNADCDSLFVPNGGTVTCTITNDDQAGTLIVKKLVKNDNGGSQVASDFSFQVNGGSATNFVQDGADTLRGKNTLTVDAGSYSVVEPAASGYTTTYSNCSNVSVSNGGTQTCIITNDDQAGSLVVKKIVKNDNGGSQIATDFSFQVNGGSATNFIQDGADTLKGKNTLTVDAGTYSVTEPAAAGYTTTYSNCDNVSVPNGGTQTCTITNDDQSGTLIVKKIVTNDNGDTGVATGFSFQVNGGSATNFTQDTDAYHGKNTLTVDAGSYSVTEPTAAGYTTSYSNCNNVAVPNGGTQTCTITNDDQQGTLIVKKQVTNDNGGTSIASDFAFSVNGGSDTQFVQDGADTLKGKNTLSVDAGNYSVTESGVTGYQTTYSTCDNLAIANGASATCTVSNDDQAGTLTVIKHVENGVLVGGKSAHDFTMSVTGTNASPASFAGAEGGTPVSVDAGSYNVDESGPAGYTGAFSSDCTGTIAIGDSKTCTVTNTAHSTIEVIKNVAGSPATGQFDFTLTGGPGSVNVTKTTNSGGNTNDLDFGAQQPGTYTLCENVPAGYSSDLGSPACTTFDLHVGEAKVVTVNNTPCPNGTLTIDAQIPDVLDGTETQTFTYDVTGPNGFTKTVSITFHAGDTELTTDVTVPIAGTYTVTQQDAPPFGPQDPRTVTIAPSGCAAMAPAFINSFAPAGAQVIETTIPAGHESGWAFALNDGATNVESVSTPTSGTGNFLGALGQHTYNIVQTPQAGWVQTASSGCNFTVNLPANSGHTFVCRVTNVQLGSISVTKTEQFGGNKPHAAKGKWRFTLDGGPAGIGHIHFSFRTNESGFTNRINFGKSTLPLGGYTLCEEQFGSWKSSLLRKKGGFRDANGNSCLRFNFAPGQRKVIHVNNVCPGTEPQRTPI